jgi:glycosyltransferase involved in cell wall biosynthesis
VELVALCDVSSLKSDLEALGVETRHADADGSFNLFADLKYVARLTRILRQEQCDGALVCCTKPNVYGAIAARLAGVNRVTLHVVGLGAAFVPGGGLKRAMIRLGLEMLYRLAGRLSTNVWFVNPNDAEYFVSRRLVPTDKTVLTLSYLDTSEYTPSGNGAADLTDVREELGIASSDRVVLMVARMIWSKGVREFAEAAALLRDRYPDARFLLAGPSDEGLDPVPESYLRERESLANLTWLGFRPDIKRLYALADMAVLPTYYKEGMPRALLEPMAMGKPLIASDSADCRGAVEHGKNGYVVPVRDSHALAAAIGRLLDDPEARVRFGEHSRIKAETEFSEDHMIPKALRALGLSTPASTASVETK